MKPVSFGWFLAIGALLVAGWGVAQEPRPFPLPTREPPLAPPDPAPANDQRPDSTPRAQIPSPIQPAQFEQPQPLPNPTRIDDGFYPSTPVVQIRVHAPSTIANGQEIVYRIAVENRSQSQANQVRVRAPIFADAPLKSSTPEPLSREKELVWELGNLEAGAKREITVILIPAATTTEVKMCARVSFEHGQCVTTKLAKQTLELKQTGAEEGVLFDPVPYRIEITNSGAVEVPNVRLTRTLSDGLEFERVSVQPTTANGVFDIQTNNSGTERTWSFGTLKPNQKRVIEFRVEPKKTGQFVMKTSLNAGAIKEEKTTNLKVLEPKLGLKVTGPESAYVGQPATYQIVINNLGTVTLNNVRVSAMPPAGCEPIRISNEGQVFREQVQWIVAKLAPGDSRTLTMSMRTPASGSKKLLVGVRADRGLEQKAEVETRFEGVATLNWKIDGEPGVAKVGAEIRYTVRITNSGSAPATNVVVKAEFPPSTDFRNAQPQPSGVGKGIISFPSQSIAPGQSAVYVVNFAALKADAAKFDFQLLADHLDKTNPVRSEPTTTISGP